MLRLILVTGLLGLWPLLTTATTEPLMLLGARTFSEGLATVQVDGKWGYIDVRGELVIPAIYSMASGMFGGRAMVIMGNERFMIDHLGKRIDEVPVELPYPHGDGTLAHFYEVDANGQLKWGFRDLQGKAPIPPQYDETFAFNEGLGMFGTKDPAIPLTGMRYGYLDMAGNEVIPARYQHSIEFSQGLAKVIDNFRHYFIDKQGNKVFGRDFAFVFDFSEGLAAVDVSATSNTGGINTLGPGEWGFIDLTGGLVIPAMYDEARPFANGVAQVRMGNYWGLINRNGKLIVPAVYLQLTDISEGLAGFLKEVGNRTKWGFVNLRGEEVIAPTFDRVGAFSEGFAAVHIEDRQGYIDRTGKYLWEPSK